ncbi:MAG: phosphoadenosine phosphosulfate reductase family protein, partial [Promethearchaeia archaeon]
PPSRTMRWCCFTNKGAPFSKFYANLKYKHVLSFDGIRKEESNLRAGYPREMDNTKYEKQYSAYPILNWTTLEVWLYILWRNLPYNNLYNYGFSRIGCWACPNNTKFDWFLFSKVYPEMVKKWITLINDYKDKQIKTMKKDDRYGKTLKDYNFSWVEEGAWKSRRVKYHNENNLISLDSPCGKHDFDLILKYPVNGNLIEFFKVFGKISKTLLPDGKNMYRVLHDDLIISFIENNNVIKFFIKDEKKTPKLKKLIFRQINKYFNCINCGACVGSCPQGAISINPHFKIDEDKCVNCLICTGTKYIDMSCIALHYKEKRIILKLQKKNKNFN